VEIEETRNTAKKVAMLYWMRIVMRRGEEQGEVRW
jgi:hypothetical protein